MPFDKRMIGIPNRSEKAMIEIDLPPGWITLDHPAFRVADVGEPVLTYVAVLSAFEAAAINAQYNRQAQDELGTNLTAQGSDYVGQNIDEMAVEGAAQVKKLLEAIKQEGYFSSWVLIEACTID